MSRCQGHVRGQVGQINADLENLVPSQEPPVSGNDPVSVHLLDHDVDERRLVPANDADAQLDVGVGPVHLDGGDLPLGERGQLDAALTRTHIHSHVCDSRRARKTVDNYHGQ